MKWILGSLAALALLASNAYAADTHGTYAKGFVCETQDQVHTLIKLAADRPLARLLAAQHISPPCPVLPYKYDARTPIGDPIFIRNIGYVVIERVHVTAMVYHTTWHMGVDAILNDDWIPTNLVRYMYARISWRPA